MLVYQRVFFRTFDGFIEAQGRRVKFCSRILSSTPMAYPGHREFTNKKTDEPPTKTGFNQQKLGKKQEIMRTKPTKTRKSKTFPESLDVETKCYRKTQVRLGTTTEWLCERLVVRKIGSPSQKPCGNPWAHGFPRTIIYLHGGCSKDFPM